MLVVRRLWLMVERLLITFKRGGVGRVGFPWLGICGRL